MNSKKTIAIVAVLTIVAGAGGFFGGMKYQESHSPAGRFASFQGQGARGGNGNFQGNFQGRGQGFQPVNGEIISTDGNSITVKMDDGSSKIVLLSDSTNINKAEAGSKEDLTEGVKVLVVGSSNSDGSVSATSVQINPTGTFRFQGNQ